MQSVLYRRKVGDYFFSELLISYYLHIHKNEHKIKYFFLTLACAFIRNLILLVQMTLEYSLLFLDIFFFFFCYEQTKYKVTEYFAYTVTYL
jgi:hypothetical protein